MRFHFQLTCPHPQVLLSHQDCPQLPSQVAQGCFSGLCLASFPGEGVG